MEFFNIENFTFMDKLSIQMSLKGIWCNLNYSLKKYILVENKLKRNY